MVFIDIHSHVFSNKEKEIPEMIEKARRARVEFILDNGLNPESNKRVLELAKKYFELKPCLGMYPSDAIDLSREELEKALDFIKEHKNEIYAIGEVGLDLKELDSLEGQEKIFRKMVELAIELDKPLIIHSRKAEKRAIEILGEYNYKKIIMHCFCGKLKLVKRILEKGWFISIPTSVKKSEQFQEIVKIAPLEKLFCETDSPYLHPDRKFPNHPAKVIESYKKIADIKKISLKEVEERIEDNFKKLFA